MFKVEIRDSQSLYDIINSEYDSTIGLIKLETEGINDIQTKLTSDDKQYFLRGNVGTIDIELPYQEINDQLKSTYNIVSKSKTQIVLEKEKREYIINLTGIGNFEFTTKGTKGTKEQFEEVLKEYGEILKVFVESHFLKIGKESPNVIYFLGQNITKYPQNILKTTSNFGSLSGKNDASNELDELERKFEVTDPNVLYEDIIGLESLKAECQRVYRDLMDPKRASFFGRNPQRQRNILICGEKGGGKTMTASALATQLKKELDNKIKFYVVDYSQITSIFRGGEAQATNKVFDLVARNEKENITTILFFDEAHQIGKRHREHNEALDVILTKLDGIKKYERTVTLSSTYFSLEELDPAFVDRHKVVVVQPLTLEQKSEIFKKAVEKKQMLAQKAGNQNLFGEIDYIRLKSALKELNGRGIGSEQGLVEAVVEWKDDITVDMGGFKPITTEEILKVLETFRMVEKPKSIGFGNGE